MSDPDTTPAPEPVEPVDTDPTVAIEPAPEGAEPAAPPNGGDTSTVDEPAPEPEPAPAYNARPGEETKDEYEARRRAALDAEVKGWLRENIRWVMAEIDYTKDGQSPESRAILNP